MVSRSRSLDQLVRGLFGGMLWILAAAEGAWYREQAEHYSLLIEHRKADRTVHDLGFLFLPTWKVWWEVAGDLGEATGRD